LGVKKISRRATEKNIGAQKRQNSEETKMPAMEKELCGSASLRESLLKKTPMHKL
jgi:hypothetical protein